VGVGRILEKIYYVFSNILPYYLRVGVGRILEKTFPKGGGGENIRENILCFPPIFSPPSSLYICFL
jgi:hypothetical protein